MRSSPSLSGAAGHMWPRNRPERQSHALVAERHWLDSPAGVAGLLWIGCASAMESQRTTVAIQHFLNDLAALRGDSPAESIVRDLIARAAQRLHLLCARLLHRSYP